MLKCGQKDNKRYTFGLRKDQTDEERDIIESGNNEYIAKCSKCGALMKSFSNYCPSCGEKI